MTVGDVEKKITAIRDLSQEKRIMLWLCASQRTNRSKWLHVTASSLALLSSGTITTAITGLVDKQAIQVIAAILAFTSGILSLIISTIYDAKETNRMYEGASRYAQLREKTQIALDQVASLSDNHCIEILKDLRTEYVSISGEFDPLLSNHNVIALRDGWFGATAALDIE